MDQMDIEDIFRTLPHKMADYTFFASAHGKFSRIGHIVGQTPRLDKFKKMEFIPCIFFDHNTMTLEINSKKKSGRTQYIEVK